MLPFDCIVKSHKPSSLGIVIGSQASVFVNQSCHQSPIISSSWPAQRQRLVRGRGPVRLEVRAGQQGQGPSKHPELQIGLSAPG